MYDNQITASKKYGKEHPEERKIWNIKWRKKS